MLHPAAFGESLGERKVRCRLCPADCILTPGKRGICASRFNSGGQLVTDNYGEAVTLALDPIEKKPLYHFYPGRSIVSTGPNCCNLACSFCQNWSISQEKAPTRFLAPHELVVRAQQERSVGVAFTYSEPIIWYEYIVDTASLLRQAGLKVVLVTNGYINREPLAQLLPHVDAFNVDLKGMSERFYARVCRGKLDPVLDAIRMIAQSPAHLEITNLIIPGENDSGAEIESLVDFVASVSPEIPLHFSAYHPDYRMTNPQTPEATLLRAAEMARRKLAYVYLGNIASEKENNTHCPWCGNVLIERSGYRTCIRGLEGDRCAGCGAKSGIKI